MSTVTEIQDTDGSLIYTGTWTNPSNAAASGGTFKQSNASGNVTVPFTGRALYLQTIFNQNNGQFTLTLDGATVPGVYSCYSAAPTSAITNEWGVLLPLVRDLPDGPHTLVLTPTAGSVYVDSFLSITGTRNVATTGNLVCLGDSWTYGYGAGSQSLNAYTARLTGILTEFLRRGVTLIRKGAPSDCYFAIDRTVSGDSTKSGCMYRLYSEAIPAAPEFLTLLFGVNDLRGTNNVGASEIGRFLRYSLSFIEDVWDCTGAVGTPIKVAVGTPGYITAPQMLAVPGNSGTPPDNFEIAASIIRSVVAQFSWCRLADVYGAMDYRDGLVYPNNQGDSGLHPNEIGHGVIAQEFARALLGVAA